MTAAPGAESRPGSVGGCLGPGGLRRSRWPQRSAIAAVTTPAGVSGAVLLLPFQVSVLGTPSPSVTPTNLLYNVIATPGALFRYWRQGQSGAGSPCC